MRPWFATITFWSAIAGTYAPPDSPEDEYRSDELFKQEGYMPATEIPCTTAI